MEEKMEKVFMEKEEVLEEEMKILGKLLKIWKYRG
jgi:hypothetical protein